MRALLVLLFALPLSAATDVTLLHFSDYHSHALPFYSEGRPDQGGIARAIGYLRREKRAGALVFSGGDMMNRGAPAWSDKYQCAEWPWFDGIVDAMALGNHEPDYGAGALRRCRESIRYPILSANTGGFDPYRVFTVKGVRIGVFAIAGPDFPRLVRVPELHFSDSVSAAREVVRRLRAQDHVNAVVLIGHEHTADDFALATAVPGIDVIFGTHSHEKHDAMAIPGTSTLFIAPYQYLTYISRVTLTFENGRVAAASGKLVRVDNSLAAGTDVAERVARMQRDLEGDPQYAGLFAAIGKAPRAVSLPRLAKLAVEVMRDSTHADIALSTVSSFRQAIPAGEVNVEALRAALPYDNEIVVTTMSGETLEKLLALGASRRGTDSFPEVTPIGAIDPRKSYRVAATDYLAGAAGYREFFPTTVKTGLRVRAELQKRLAALWR